MKLNQLKPLSEDPNVTFTSRSRALLYAAMAATALSVTACGGNGHDGPEGTGGSGAAGETGTGGNETGGMSGEAGSETGGTGATETGGGAGEAGGETGGSGGASPDPCYLVSDRCDDLYICNGLLTQDLAVGETGTWTADIDSLQAGAQFRLHIDDPNVVTNENTVIFVRHAVSASVDFVPQGAETQLDSFQGVNAVLVDRTDPFKADCSVKGVPLGDRVQMDFTRVYTGVYHASDGQIQPADDATVTAEGTEVRTDSFSTFLFVDEPPVNEGSAPTVTKLANGKVRVTTDGSQLTDQGVPLQPELTTVKIGDQTLRRINDTTYETEDAVTTGATVAVKVLGANGTVQGHAADELVIEDVPVEVQTVDLCAGVDCDDSNPCTTGVCDPADGICDQVPNTGDSCNDGNDNTINDECNAEGVCEGETVECINNTQCDDGNVCNGTETCGTDNTCVDGTSVVCGNNASCEEPGGDCVCDTDMVPSNVNSEDCVPDPCLTEDCNGNGTCSQGADDSAECACDNEGLDPADNCGSCDTGYYNYPACEVIPPAPVISNLAIDCSSTVDICLSEWPTPYPVTFNVTDATSCTLTSEYLGSGSSGSGTNSAVTLDGNNASATHDTTNILSGAWIELKAECEGPGGTSTPVTHQYQADYSN